MTVGILAIGAHPDDAEIGCAGLLLKARARGMDTGIVVLTRGEMSSFAEPGTRVKEAQAAAKILGVAFFAALDLPDAGLEFNIENALLITRLLRELRPRLVVTPDFDDHHPDHVVVAQLVERASFLATRTALLPDLEPLIPQPQHLTYALSFQRPSTPSLVLDITDVYGTKQKALQAHSSQLGPAVFAAEIAARYYGMMLPAAYGEGFLHRGPFRLTSGLAII
jgi:bacillithiol biosynthesis deacetylase BshB1